MIRRGDVVHHYLTPGLVLEVVDFEDEEHVRARVLDPGRGRLQKGAVTRFLRRFLEAGYEADMGSATGAVGRG